MERWREAQLQSHLMELCWICCWTIVRLFEWKLFLMETHSKDDALRGKICFPKWISCCWLRRIEKFSFRLSSLVFRFACKFESVFAIFCFDNKSWQDWSITRLKVGSLRFDEICTLRELIEMNLFNSESLIFLIFFILKVEIYWTKKKEKFNF